MNIKPIKTKKDYKEALQIVDKLWDAKQNTPEGDKLDILVTLIEAYEAKVFPIKNVDPVEAIKFRMEQVGLKPADISEIFGGPNRASEILNKKRGLNINMAKRLHKQLNIPAEALLA